MKREYFVPSSGKVNDEIIMENISTLNLQENYRTFMLPHKPEAALADSNGSLKLSGFCLSFSCLLKGFTCTACNLSSKFLLIIQIQSCATYLVYIISA
jgi:hypothetical protein